MQILHIYTPKINLYILLRLNYPNKINVQSLIEGP